MLIENFVSIIILRRCTKLLFQIRSLSLNLAISDFVTGFILALPNSVLITPFQCDFKKYLSFLCINVSLLIITMMNLDRYFAFAYAMRYYSFITKKLISRLCIGAWMLSFLLTYGMFFRYDSNFVLTCEVIVNCPKNEINTTFKCTLLSLGILNFVIFGYFLREIRKRSFQVHFNKAVNFSEKQSRTVRKVSLIVGLFLVGFFPFITIITFPIFNLKEGFGKSIYLLTAFLLLLNSAINPVMYVWRFQEARYHFKKLLCFWNKTMVDMIDQKHNQKTASFQFKTIPM